MFTLTADNRDYRLSGLALFISQLFLFVLALPPFRATVVSGHTEMLVLMMYALNCMTGIWLGVGLLRGWLKVQNISHPLWLCLLAWTAWQIIVTFFADIPYHSWAGALGIYDGTGRYVVLLLNVILAYILWQIPLCRRRIIYAAAGAIAIQCILQAIFSNAENTLPADSWAPFNWSAYLAFMAGYFWIAAANKNLKHLCALTAALLVTLYFSQNKSSIILAVAALAALGLQLPLPPRIRRFFYPNKYWRIMCMALCVLPMIAIIGVSETTSFFAPSSLSNSSYYPYARERIALDQVALAAIKHEPSRLIVGHGWGRFTDDLFQYGLLDGVRVFDNGVRDPNWLLIDGAIQHCHNQPMETLLASGIPGLILWYALPMLLLWNLPRRRFWVYAPMLVAMTALCHLWFQLPQCIAYEALALAALLTLCISKKEPVLDRFHRGALACLSIGLLMGWSTYTQLNSMAHADFLLPYALNIPYSEAPQKWIDDDLEHGGERWEFAAFLFTMNMKKMSESHQINANMAEWMEKFLLQADKAALTPKLGARIASVETWMQNIAMDFHDPLLNKARSEAAHAQEDAVLQITSIAPLRDDIAEPFLYHLEEYTNNDAERQISILKHILAIAPNHRGALWKLGNILHDKDMLKRAVALHAEYVYPITDEELSKLSW